MIQRGERLRLPLEAAQPIRIDREILRQHLHRYVAVEPRVPRPEDLAHPAGADVAGDSVLVDRRADQSSSSGSLPWSRSGIVAERPAWEHGASRGQEWPTPTGSRQCARRHTAPV